jgi:multidrug resistance efflux pump
MIFTKPEQTEHRKAFIEECRQKAWGAACHADWISKGMDEIMASYTKLQAEDSELEAAIKAAEVAPDYHTVENRNKRKAMQERRNTLAKQMELLAKNMQQGQQAMAQLIQSTEASLALAKHAEGWEWKEVETIPEHKSVEQIEDDIAQTHGTIEKISPTER